MDSLRTSLLGQHCLRQIDRRSCAVRLVPAAICRSNAIWMESTSSWPEKKQLLQCRWFLINLTCLSVANRLITNLLASWLPTSWRIDVCWASNPLGRGAVRTVRHVAVSLITSSIIAVSGVPDAVVGRSIGSIGSVPNLLIAPAITWIGGISNSLVCCLGYRKPSNSQQQDESDWIFHAQLL